MTPSDLLRAWRKKHPPPPPNPSPRNATTEPVTPIDRWAEALDDKRKAKLQQQRDAWTRAQAATSADPS